jgi:hypothetical protein
MEILINTRGTLFARMLAAGERQDCV